MTGIVVFAYIDKMTFFDNFRNTATAGGFSALLTA